jgi:hypothetical protein
VVGTGRESMPTKVLEILVNSSSIVAKHSLHHPKVYGLSQAIVAGTGRNNMAKKVLKFLSTAVV